jgi:hypothetical protein
MSAHEKGDKSQTEEELVLPGNLWFRGAMITEVTFKNYRAIEDAPLNSAL